MNAEDSIPKDATPGQTPSDLAVLARAERALAEERTVLRALIDHLPVAVYVKDREGRFLVTNLTHAQLVGAPSPEAMIGKTDADFYPPDQVAMYRSDEEEMYRTGRDLVNKEEPHRDPRGRMLSLITTKVLFRDAEGRVQGIVGASRDITERKQAELERQKFVSLADQSAEFIGMCDVQFRPFYVNAAGMRLVGLDSLVEACAVRVQDFFYPEDQPYILNEFFPQVLRNRHAEVEIRFRHFKTGEALWMIYNVFQLRGDDGQPLGYATVSRNITERKHAEATLRAQEQEFRTLIEASPSGLIMVNNDGTIRMVNPQVQKMFGYRADELIGQPVEILVPQRHRGEHPQMRQDYSAHPVARPMGKGRDLRALRKDGTELPVEIGLSPIETPAGRFTLATIVDITARKQAEELLRLLNTTLEQRVAERTAELTASNKELEAFAYSVAHDLRAPLRSIDGFSRMVIEEQAGKLDETGRDYLHRVSEAAQHMGRLIDDLLNLSRITRAELRRQSLDLSALAHKVAAHLQESQPDRVVHWQVADGLRVAADARLMQVVLENLLGNAWKFTAHQPQPAIEFGRQTRDGEQVYYVRDNGAGFDMAYVHKLFGAFQRLHGVHEFEGTGIGLATVARIIQRHGGRIWAEGAINSGATFYFTLERKPAT